MAQKLGKGELAVWRGYLTLIERHKKKCQFLNLFWHLIHKDDGSVWILGYKHQTVGSACVKEFKILAFTRDFKVPEDARPFCSGGEHVICLQTSNDVIFLTADSEQKQEAFFVRLAHELESPLIPHDMKSHSALSQTSLHNIYDNTGEIRKDPRTYEKIYANQGDVLTHTYMNTDCAGVAEVNIPPNDDDAYSSISDNESLTSYPPSLPPPRNDETKSSKQTKPNMLSGKEHRHPGKDQRLGTSPTRELEANMRGSDSPCYPSIITEETTSKQQTVQEFIKTLRSQKFKMHLNIRIQKPLMNWNWKEIKLCRVKDDMIAVAGLSPSKHRLLHVGDVILKVNNQALPSPSEFYKRLRSCGTNEVDLEVLRVPNGCLYHGKLPSKGRIERLGLTFADNEKCGVEVISINENGLVFRSKQFQSSSTEGIVDPAKRVNWGLVEINGVPVPLDSSKKQVEQLLRDAGIELALVFLPMDLVLSLRDSCCTNKVEQGE